MAWDQTEYALPYWQIILALHADQHFANSEFLRDRDKKQARYAAGFVGGVGNIEIATNALTNITEFLTLPANEAQPQIWLLIGFANVQRQSGTTCRVSFTMDALGGSGGVATDGTYEFAASGSLRGSFVKCQRWINAGINESLQIRLQAQRVAGTANMMVHGARIAAIRVGA